MVELSHRERTVRVKIVYYGPPYSGKTTNLQLLHQAALEQRRGELISVNSAQDRTILFDLLPLRTRGFRGFDLRLQLVAVPGQAQYAATRRVVLKGADSLVFVANSAADRWDENVQSLREMTQNLLSHHLDPSALPLVLQYNKRDLPQVSEIDALDRALNARRTKAIPAVACEGQGVLETFTAILERTVQDLASRYAILDVRGASPVSAWVEETVRQLFGARELVTVDLPEPDPADTVAIPLTPSEPPPPPLERAPAQRPPAPNTVVRVAPPTAQLESAAVPSDSRISRAEQLVETYAEAAAQVGAALSEVREERDTLRSQLEELRRSYQCAEKVLDGTPLELAIAPVLDSMAALAGVEQAAFWKTQADALPRAVALRGLDADPLLAEPKAAREVAAAAASGNVPAVQEGDPHSSLAEALVADGRFVGVLPIPFRTPGGLQAVAVFYFAADSARPGAKALARLSEIPRVLSSALELAATLQTVRSAERALELALAGTASQHGLEHVVVSLERLRDRMGEIRGRSDAPPWFVEQYVELAPALADALEGVRSLLAFGAGELRRESVLVADLLQELVATDEVVAEIAPAAEPVPGDATLLRLALRAAADEVRARAGGQLGAAAACAAQHPLAAGLAARGGCALTRPGGRAQCRALAGRGAAHHRAARGYAPRPRQPGHAVGKRRHR